MRHSERGFSLIEITVVLAIVSALMILTYKLIEETATAALFTESHNDLNLLSQQASNAIQTELIQTKLVFQDDALGKSYRDALALPSSAGAWSATLMPLFDPATTTLQPDPVSTRYTGNALLLARQLPPLSVMYDDDKNAGTPEVELLADRYRFQYIYLRRDTAHSFAASGMSLDLMMSTSADYADAFQLASIGTSTGAIATKLMTAGLSQAWDPGKPLDNAFYALSGATDGTLDAPLKKPSIPIARTKSLLRGLLGGRIAGKMSYSAAFGKYPIQKPLSVFAKPIVSTPGFPGGFEVKIIGPAGNRQVLTRIVLMSHYGKTYEAQQASMITAARF